MYLNFGHDQTPRQSADKQVQNRGLIKIGGETFSNTERFSLARKDGRITDTNGGWKEKRD